MKRVVHGEDRKQLQIGKPSVTIRLPSFAKQRMVMKRVVYGEVLDSAELRAADPAKEANAQATRLTSHTTTLANEYAKQGRDWEAELHQRAKEVLLMEELGLTTSEAGPTKVTKQEEDEIEEQEQQAAA